MDYAGPLRVRQQAVSVRALRLTPAVGDDGDGAFDQTHQCAFRGGGHGTRGTAGTRTAQAIPMPVTSCTRGGIAAKTDIPALDSNSTAFPAALDSGGSAHARRHRSGIL